MKDKIRPNDWVKIVYGEFKGSFGKVGGRKKTGSYSVIVYKDLLEPANGSGTMVELEEDALEVLEPYVLSQKELIQFARAQITYQDIAEKVFPPFNIVASRKYSIKVEDIKQALHNINNNPVPLPVFKQWFWIILNIFYDSLNIKDRYDEDLFTDFPKDEKEIFSTVFSLAEKLYWRLEERFGAMEDNEGFLIKFDDEPLWDKEDGNNMVEMGAYLAVCDEISGRVDSYLYNKDKPEGQWIYSNAQMRSVISSYEFSEDLEKATPEALALYREFVRRLYLADDTQALRILAFNHLDGSRAYAKNYELAKMYMEELFEKTGDPYAANALGHIYYFGKDNIGPPDYEKAFKYYSFGALEGIDESVDMCADMLIEGEGTVKNVEMGLNILVDGYKSALDDFCHGDFDCHFAEYSIHMGECAYNDYFFGMGKKDAYRFYLEAEYATKKRIKKGDNEDRQMLSQVRHELEKIRKEVGLDPNRTQLKADFPLFINHMFEFRYPVKVYIRQKNENTFVLKLRQVDFKDFLSNLRIESPEFDQFEDDFRTTLAGKILVTYPELSYTELVSELEYTLENATLLKKPIKPDGFLCDGFRRNEHTNALEFYAGPEIVAAIEAEKYVINVKKKNNKG